MDDSTSVNNPPTPTGTDSTSSPHEQEAQATLNVTQSASLPGSSRSPKIIIGLLIAIVVVVMGAVGYYLMTRLSGAPTSQVNETVTVAPTKTIAPPTLKNEQEEVDMLDTTFPESDMNSIQNNLQGL